MKSKFVLVFGILLVFGFIGCAGGGTSALVGKWVPEEGQSISDDFVEERLELKKDGTGIGDGLTLDWTAEKGRITLKLDIGLGFTYDYKISGSTLTLTNDDGESVKYKKQ
jgi:hypothetical protein